MNRTGTYTAVELDGSLHVVSGRFEVDEALAEPRSAEADAAYRSAMRVLAAGLVMVTTWHEGRPWGLTISACCSVSADPPEVLISLRSTTVSCRAILDEGRFGVSILSAKQKALAEFGSAVGAAKFLDEYCQDPSREESPMIAGALYHFDCELDLHQEVADHTLFVGRIRNVVFPPRVDDADPAPLVYFNRAFWNLGNEI